MNLKTPSIILALWLTTLSANAAVTITSTVPSSGTTYTAKTTLYPEVKLSTNTGVTKVRLLLDGVEKCVESAAAWGGSTSPSCAYMVSSPAQNGIHKFKFEIYTGSASAAVSKEVSFSVAVPAAAVAAPASDTLVLSPAQATAPGAIQTLITNAYISKGTKSSDFWPAFTGSKQLFRPLTVVNLSLTMVLFSTERECSARHSLPARLTRWDRFGPSKTRTIRSR